MAQLALGFVGTALGATFGPLGAKVGGFIGATLGGMIDNQLFPTKQEGPRLDDLSVQSSAYGAILPLIYGPENRATGAVIWSTPLVEHKKTEKQGGKGGPSVSTTEYSYTCSFAVALSARTIKRITKVFANGKSIFDVTLPDDTALFTAMRVYLGTETQLPDSLIEASMGVGMTPAFRGTSYVVFEDLQLADFASRIPNMEFFIEADETISTETIVSDIIVRCGIDLNTASTHGSRGDCLGFMISGASSGIGAIQPLAMAYNFDVAEDSGQLVCISKDSGIAGIILAESYAGHDGSEDRPQAITWARSVETDLPKSSFIQYYDPALDLQQGSQRDDRQFGNAQNNLSTDLAVTLTADDARRTAQRALWEAWYSRQTATLQTDDRWIGLRVGRQYLFETPAGLEGYKIMRKTRGVNGVIDLDVRRQSSGVYSLSTTGAAASVPDNVPRSPGPAELILLDIPLLIDDDAAKPTGFYWGVVGSGPGWRGADVYRALDISSAYNLFGTSGSEAKAGDCDTTLAPWIMESGADVWDTVSTVKVTLRRPDMTLESMADDEVLAGANAAYIGPQDGHDGELIGFATATYVSPGVYTLSRLLRGRHGTSSDTGGHGPGELFVLLEFGAIQRTDFGAADIGLERAYKAVSVLTFIEDAVAVLFTNDGAGDIPLS